MRTLRGRARGAAGPAPPGLPPPLVIADNLTNCQLTNCQVTDCQVTDCQVTDCQVTDCQLTFRRFRPRRYRAPGGGGADTERASTPSPGHGAFGYFGGLVTPKNSRRRFRRPRWRRGRHAIPYIFQLKIHFKKDSPNSRNPRHAWLERLSGMTEMIAVFGHANRRKPAMRLAHTAMQNEHGTTARRAAIFYPTAAHGAPPKTGD